MNVLTKTEMPEKVNKKSLFYLSNTLLKYRLFLPAPKLDIDNLENGYHGLVKENETVVEVTPAIRAVGEPVCGFRIVNKHHGEAPFDIVSKEDGYAELRARRVLNCEKRRNYKFDIAAVGCDGKQGVR